MIAILLKMLTRTNESLLNFGFDINLETKPQVIDSLCFRTRRKLRRQYFESILLSQIHY